MTIVHLIREFDALNDPSAGTESPSEDIRHLSTYTKLLDALRRSGPVLTPDGRVFGVSGTKADPVILVRPAGPHDVHLPSPDRPVAPASPTFAGMTIQLAWTDDGSDCLWPVGEQARVRLAAIGFENGVHKDEIMRLTSLFKSIMIHNRSPRPLRLSDPAGSDRSAVDIAPWAFHAVVEPGARSPHPAF